MDLIEIKWMVGKSGGKRCWAYSYCEVCKEWVLLLVSIAIGQKTPNICD